MTVFFESAMRAMDRIARPAGRPLWSWAASAAAVLGQGKSFHDNPILGSERLNRAGLHVARIVIAHAMTRAREAQLAWMVPREVRRAYRRDGFVVIEDFLSPSELAALHDEARAYAGPVRDMAQGDTITRRVLIDDDARRALPVAARVATSRRLQRLLRYASARDHAPLVYLQQIRNKHSKGGRDPQKDLHSDTFHPTMKAWLFLEDVTEDAGPFTYVPGSHRLSLARLRWEHAQSLRARASTNRYASRGSLRVTTEDLRAMGLPDPVRLAVRANTLVIADTHGFHARGECAKRATRLELWAFARGNPFLPLAFVRVPGLSRIEHAALRWWWRHDEARAAREKVRPRWRATEGTFAKE